jgi:hypothetical protein
MIDVDHIEQLMVVPAVAKIPAIGKPYQRTTSELISLSYETVGPAHKKLSRDIRGLQSNHIAFMNRQVLPEAKDKEYAMLNAISILLKDLMMVVIRQRHTKMCLSKKIKQDGGTQ